MSDIPKVLIVDDQPRNLDTLEAMLEPIGCAFVRALSADEALLALLRHDFAAIVLDINMPGMGGIELATLIKQRKRSQHVPILFLTAHQVDDDDVLRGYGVGAVDYLSKPLNAEILRSKIGVFIELFRTSIALRALNDALQREIADRERAQEDLRLVNHELETRVHERTAELMRVHRGVGENEERLRMAIEVARMGAWEWLIASGQMTWSIDPEVLFEFPRGSLGADLRVTRMLHPDDRPRIDKAIASALDSGAYEAEYRAVRPDGSIVWLTERGRVVPDSDGKPERMVGITRDVTAEREARQQREKLLRDAREARDEAEAASRAKDEFLAMLSHELRNPLNVIAGGIAILDAAGKPDERSARTRQLVARQVQHLTHLMDDLLDIARVTSGKIVLNRAPLELGRTAKRCLATLSGADRLSRHTCRMALEPVWVDADETRVEQIITNLVGNAAKFTPAGGEIRVVVTCEGHDAILRVEDTGVGIAPELLPQVFDLFVQGDGSIDRAPGGLGLGLTLVRRLAEMHGGTVAAASEGAGRGASFTIRLPRITPPPILAEVSPEPASAAPRRILVVEDNPDGREMLRTLLELQGHEVHDVAEGQAAIEQALELRPHAAIIDIGLPGIDGYAVAARIRANESGAQHMRLIALTGYGSEQDRRRAIEAGFDAHLTKPVEPKRLALLLSLQDG
jgi:signal transduction histidine kinase/DNA-binding response OmpR family regulator